MDAAGTLASAPRRASQFLALAAGGVFACLFLAAAAIALFGNPRAGEPVARLDLPPLAFSLRQVAAVKPVPASSAATPAAAPPLNVTKPLFAGHALLADPDLIENTPEGPLPRIADDGRKPMNVYAAPVSPGHMRIAIVVSGLGISAKETAAALADLPPGVTLAFAPYADDVQRWVAEARMFGHEALLEVPMEPYDFPDSDPGPHTLRTGLDEASNLQRLAWVLSRATGYTGVTNLLGQRFLTDADSLSPVLTYLARRGLIFYDNGMAQNSTAPDVAARVDTAFVRATESIDTIQSALEIDRRLSDLETQARAHGSAVGSAFLYPVSIARIAAWASGLPGRGFVLVPISAIVSK